jgi:hypothetical protein
MTIGLFWTSVHTHPPAGSRDSDDVVTPNLRHSPGVAAPPRPQLAR